MKRLNIATKTFLGLWSMILPCLAIVLMVVANTVLASTLVDNTIAPKNNIVVPDTFLRSWDSVTIFFDSDQGKPGQPEDEPEKFVSLTPEHPGSYTWLNSKTLQFKPAEPWSPLTRYQWTIENTVVSLDTLIFAPTATVPANGAKDLNPVDTIELTFPTPVELDALKAMLSIELRPLPGVDANDSDWLDATDFDIKALERSQRNQQATYLISLTHPIQSGYMAIVHLRLSLREDQDQSFYQLKFATAKPFEVEKLGCSNQSYPLTVTGSLYTRDQAIACDSSRRQVEVTFSSPPAALDALAGRNLVRMTPAVDNATYSVVGNKLVVKGQFSADQLYQLTIDPIPLQDEKGRALNIQGPSELFVFFPQLPSFINWQKAYGILERYGPQMLPLKGRGHQRIDLRIHPIDPQDRSFWPFAQSPVSVDEQSRPESPGEAPEVFTNRDQHISSAMLRRQIKALGSPSFSQIIDMPLSAQGQAAEFGLDIKPYLTQIKGVNAPGTYLVGMRQLNRSTDRHWMRVQVTDLSLSTVYETDKVLFVVTSLKTGLPVPQARVVVQGKKTQDIVSGTTNDLGQFAWSVRGKDTVMRILISKGEDTLALNPLQGPDTYANNLWQNQNQRWLQWTQYHQRHSNHNQQFLSHIFTERPVYKPQDVVHIKGYVREVENGTFSVPELARKKPQLHISGPGNQEWNYDLTITKHGSFYHVFNEEKLPTGTFTAQFKYRGGLGAKVEFKKEAYRLPKFEVQLNGPDTTGLDDAFNINLTAEYYAGGQVVGRPTRWRVTQFPYSWSPKKKEGYYYSTDARFSRHGAFRSQALSFEEQLTDEFGSASIRIDPTLEPTAQARRYVVEATVVGADDQSVSSTFEAKALPPLVLGLKVPRYTQTVDNLEAMILVEDAVGNSVEGQSVNVRLQHRQWHSHLQAADFSQGEARYVTSVVDETILETEFLSNRSNNTVPLPIQKAGVYIVEIETVDKMGRLQSVKVDLFAGGQEPVTWSKQPAQVFKVTPEKSVYQPGESATLILQSPYQKARALAIVEQADGRNHYEWLNINNGTATYTVDVKQSDLPRLPVHFLLMRGRVPTKKVGNIDLGKPATLAATTYVEVSTINNQVDVQLDYPKKVQPGDTVEVAIELKDHFGQPLAGEMTLWLVDQSVLALGKEQPIDPLPNFIPHRDSFTRLRDTRNLLFGFLPFKEQPGGGVAAEALLKSQRSALLDNVTVRKNFSSVPYFNPSIELDHSGKKTVTVQMPDNLSNFKLRAKVISGASRFGFHKGQIAVRLPVIVQPALPRFVRPGDRFTATAIGRVVEGKGGAGIAQMDVSGLEITGEPRQSFVWDNNKPQRLAYQVQVPTPMTDTLDPLEQQTVSVTVAVERTEDQARDAFKVSLPVHEDRQPVIIKSLHTLEAGKPLVIPEVTEPVRPGTWHRSVLISNQPQIIHLSAGLNYLLEYPHGCTEQRLSKARAVIASEQFRSLLMSDLNQSEGDKDQSQGDTRNQTIILDTLKWLEQVQADNGLIGYWPGSRGYVSLTAWSVMFMVEVRQTGLEINENQFEQMVRALKKAMRSDYDAYIAGEAYAERSWALAALAMAGESTGAYAAELARKANYLNLEALAQVIVALSQANAYSEKQLEKLYQKLWEGMVFRLHQGHEVYGGLQERAQAKNALILPSETRAVAEVLRAVSRTPKPLHSLFPEERKQTLINALVGLGSGNGWGSTNANAAALLSLTDVLAGKDGIDHSLSPIHIELKENNKLKSIVLGEKPLFNQTIEHQKSVTISRLKSEESDDETDVIVMSDSRYTPVKDGSAVTAKAAGLVVNREFLHIQNNGAPAIKMPIDRAEKTFSFKVGDVVEEHLEVVNPADAHYVAVIVPLAAGMEPLNPALATAPPEAKPDGQLSLQPAYVAFKDQQMAYYYDTLPKGTYQFYFRVRATIPGTFIQPAAYAQKMYQESVYGSSHGAKVLIEK